MARLERRPAERVAVAGFIVQIIVGIVAIYFAAASDSAAAKVLAWESWIAVIPWIVCLIHLRQNRLAEEEAIEYERLQAEREAGGARGQLFEADEIQAFAHRNRLRILESYVLPTFAVIIVLFMAVATAMLLWRNVIPQARIDRDTALISMAVMAAVTFTQFLIAMYAAGMARQIEWRPLRAGAGYMMMGTLFAFATAVSLMLGQFGVYKPDWYIAYGMLALMALIGVEILLNFILDFYRPRVEGVEPRPSYDSRLLSLLTQPGGIFKTVAATLDYQFGFRVSQTWFYRFVENALAPLILFQIITLYLLTCIVIVGPEQQGVVETWGKFDPQTGVIGPGLHFKWPWPVQRAHRFDANAVKTLTLGHVGEMEDTDRMLWTAQHYTKEYNVMVATREAVETKDKAPAVNLIVASATVRYRVNDVAKWYYNCSSRQVLEGSGPETLLEALCNRELIKYLAGVDFFDVMGAGRQRAIEHLKSAMQRAADSVSGAYGLGLGVEILGVGLEGVHPPVAEELPQKFHEKVVARVQQRVDELEAERASIEMNIDSQSEAARIKVQAQTDYWRAVAESKARAERFLTQGRAYSQFERVFRARAFLSALETALSVDPVKDRDNDKARPRIVVIGVGKGLDREHVRLNLEDPTQSGIEDLQGFRRVDKE